MPETQFTASPESKPPKVSVVALRKLSQGNLKAFVSVKVGPLTVHDFRVIQQPGQRAYVSVPQRSYQDAEGKTKYSPALEMPEVWKTAIQAAVLDAFDGEAGTEKNKASEK